MSSDFFSTEFLHCSLKLKRKYYAYRLDADLFKKVDGILSSLNGLKLEELNDLNEPESSENKIVFFNVDLPDSARMIESARENQFIAIAQNQEDAFRAVRDGALDCILTSDLSRDAVSKSLIIADRFLQSEIKTHALHLPLDILLEQGYDAFITQNSQYEIISASSSTASLFGRESHDLIGTNALFLISPKDQNDYNEAIQKLILSDKTLVKLKLRILNAANESNWAEVVIIDNTTHAEVGGLITALRSIDEQDRVEQELALAELKYRTLVETTSDGAWYFDLENNEVSWSDGFYKILGYNFDDRIIPQSIAELAHPDDREHVMEEMNEKMYAGRPYQTEFRIRKKSGQYIWIIAEGNGIKNGKDKLIWILGAIKNIDKRKRAELDLAVSKERIENIANGINGVLARHREYPDGTVKNLYISSGIKEIWGLTSEEVLAHPEKIWLQLEEAELKSLEAAFYQAVKRGEKLDHVYSLKNKEGQIKYLHVIGIPKKFEDGTIEWDSITTDVTSLKLARDKSNDQQLLLENIIYNIDGSVQRYKVDAKGKSEILFMSNGFEKMTGIAVKDAIRDFDLMREQIPTEDRVKIQESIEQSIQNLTEWKQTWRITDKNGTRKWLQGSGIPIKKADGSVIIDSVITDITNLKNITSQLSSTKQEFKLAAKAAQLGLWKHDPVKDILEWDEQMFKIFGVAPEDFGGTRQDWIDVLHPDDREKSMNALADTINSAADLEFQFRIIKKDTKETRHIRASANTVVDKNGESAYLIGLNWDVTHIVRAQEKITETNNRYALASKASQDAIWDLDLKTNTLKWSQSFTDLFGHDVNLDMNHLDDWATLVHPDDYHRVVRGLDKFIATGKNKWEERYRFKKGDGEYAHVNDRGFIVRDYNGRATRMVGTMRDVTANTEFLKAIEIQNEKLKKIAWTQSHELRGPLTRIMGLTDLVEHDGFKDVTIKDFLNYLNDATSELDQVIREIIDTSEEIGIYTPEKQR